MYKRRVKTRERYSKALEKIFNHHGFKNFKHLLTKIKCAEVGNRESLVDGVLEFHERKEEKNRIKEVDVWVVQ